MVLDYRPDPFVPNIIAIGVPDIAALERVRAKLRANQIAAHYWHEPDNDLGFTAIATIPLNAEQKQVLANYRLWNEANCSPGAAQAACSLAGDGGAIQAGL